MADPAAWHGQAAAAARLRRRGVDPAKPRHARVPVSRSQSNGTVVQASYTGIVPDTFKDGAEVVLKGTLGPRRLPRRAERRDGEVPVEVRSQPKPGARAPNTSRSAGRQLPSRHHHACTRNICCCSPAFVVCAYAVAASVAGARRRSTPADRERHRRVLPGHRADDRRVGGHRPRLRHRRLLDQVRAALLGRGAAAGLQDHRRTGAGSTARSCSGCSCCRSSASIAVYINRERHRELIPYVVASIAVVGDVLPLPDGRAQQPVLDLPDADAGRRRRG